MANERIPAETWPVGRFVLEEMDARGWTLDDVMIRGSTGDTKGRAVDRLALEIVVACLDEPGLILGNECAALLSRAFGVSAQFFLNLDAAHRAALSARDTTNGK